MVKLIPLLYKAYSAAIFHLTVEYIGNYFAVKKFLRENNWQGAMLILLLIYFISGQNNIDNNYAAKKLHDRIISKAYSAAIFHLAAE